MRAFDASLFQYRVRSEWIDGRVDFTVALWVRTTQTDAGTLIGGQISGGDDDGRFAIWLNFNGEDGDAGKIYCHARNDSTGRNYLASASPASLFDGTNHLVVFRRSGSSFTAFLDGAQLSLTVAENTMGTFAVPSLPLALGAMYFDDGNSQTTDIYASATIGELAIWSRALTTDELAGLAARCSPLAFPQSLDCYWPAEEGGSDDEIVGGAAWLGSGTHATHVAIEQLRGVGGFCGADMRRHYEVYVSPAAPAVVGVDAPTAIVPAGAVDAALSGLTLAPNAVYFVSVVARNEQGRAAAAIGQFITDGAGQPLTPPTPVALRSATAIASGYVRVEWDYVEQAADAVASTFEISAAPQFTGGVAPSPVVVAHDEPRANYSAVIGPLADGVWYVTVRSVGPAGQKISAVNGVHVRTDSTAPTETLYGLEAVEA
ncbi:MAG: LamG-like jellyroll fold domain-containing protein [Phycisphaerae bacterium]